MSEHLALYALPAMGKIELAWPKRNKPSDIAGQSSDYIWGSGKRTHSSIFYHGAWLCSAGSAKKDI
ncbi:hypothetical protein [Aeromonas hydrophila]|uniref:hypothetical protein n=1 Tax=Aeromonas hydrophila TaxID=644 RepID=UPI002B478C37|nr:hypothetical protein [Aeromonas hydrophila]